jgi:hypothetical protein
MLGYRFTNDVLVPGDATQVAPGEVTMSFGGKTKPLQEMDVQDVSVWLQQQGLGHLSKAFSNHKITGAYIGLVSAE